MKWFNLVTIFTLVFISSFMLVGATESDIGIKQIDTCIDLIQTCADCSYVNFSSYTMPNGTRVIIEAEAVKNGISFTYNDCNITSQIGTWIIDGHGDVGGTDTVFAYTYEVTNNGKPVPEGMPIFQMGVLIIIFATACFLLYLSSQMGEVGFKIFFLLTSLIFLAATMISAYMVGVDGNISSNISSTFLALFVVLGSILFIIFIWVLIRQTINALDMYNIKKGRSLGIGYGSSVGGFNTRRAY